LEPPRFSFARTRATREVRPNFRQPRIVAFTPACCYAKSAPAAAHGGDGIGFDVLNRLAKDRNQDSMACGKQPAVPPHAAGGWHRLEQGLLVA
jgi:hypothetical protein